MNPNPNLLTAYSVYFLHSYSSLVAFSAIINADAVPANCAIMITTECVGAVYVVNSKSILAGHTGKSCIASAGVFLAGALRKRPFSLFAVAIQAKRLLIQVMLNEINFQK